MTFCFSGTCYCQMETVLALFRLLVQPLQLLSGPPVRYEQLYCNLALMLKLNCACMTGLIDYFTCQPQQSLEPASEYSYLQEGYIPCSQVS